MSHPAALLLALPLLVTFAFAVIVSRRVRSRMRREADPAALSRLYTLWIFRSMCYGAASCVWLVVAFGSINAVIAAAISAGALLGSALPLRTLDP